MGGGGQYREQTTARGTRMRGEMRGGGQEGEGVETCRHKKKNKGPFQDDQSSLVTVEIGKKEDQESGKK